MKKLYLMLLFFGISSFTFAQKTYIPDHHFEQALIDLGLDDVLDDSVLTASIDTVTRLDVSGKNISDLTGIEGFSTLKKLYCSQHLYQLTNLDVSHNIALTDLDCSNNQLTNLDVSHNIALTYLACGGNQLTSLDVSQNIALTYLECGGNQLTNLDISHIIALTHLGCGRNQLTNLDVSHNIALTHLACGGNQLTNLDVSHNIALTYLGCGSSQLTNLDISHNIALNELDCSYSQLSTLDLSKNINLKRLLCNNNKISFIDVSNNLALVYFLCYENQLTTLDVSNNTLLEGLDCSRNNLTNLDLNANHKLQGLGCSGNQLSKLDLSNNPDLVFINCTHNRLVSLNVKNGNNTIIRSFYARNNPNLTCILVDDAAWSTANWPDKDATATYSENCSCCGTDTDGDGIPDSQDDYPNDANRAFDNYFPAAGFGSLAFEDLWPGKGDYDFNDVVVDYRFKTVTNASNHVVEIFGTFVAKASGASLENGFGFNLPDASTALTNNPQELTVTGYDVHARYVKLNQHGFEEGQDKPTVIVFDNIFNLLCNTSSGIGVNTEQNATFVSFDTLTIKITPTSNQYTALDFSLETWNPFIIINQERGKEVHLPDYPPTSLADTTYFKTMDDDSDPASGKYYKTKNNLPWAINIISTFDWPLEKVNISDAYLHFVDWAKSSGSSYNDWYEKKSGYRDDSKIYVVPQK